MPAKFAVSSPALGCSQHTMPYSTQSHGGRQPCCYRSPQAQQPSACCSLIGGCSGSCYFEALGLCIKLPKLSMLPQGARALSHRAGSTVYLVWRSLSTYEVLLPWCVTEKQDECPERRWQSQQPVP